MSDQNDTELRAKLRSEILKSQQFQPNLEQDAIFQEVLEAELGQRSKSSTVKHPWFAAAMVILAFGLFTIFAQGYFSNSKEALPVAELINASNEIESELASFDRNELSSLQYIEALKIRDDIGELDNALNELYQAKSSSSGSRMYELWQQRLYMAQQLKAIYTNEYTVARI